MSPKTKSMRFGKYDKSAEKVVTNDNNDIRDDFPYSCIPGYDVNGDEHDYKIEKARCQSGTGKFNQFGQKGLFLHALAFKHIELICYKSEKNCENPG